MKEDYSFIFLFFVDVLYLRDGVRTEGNGTVNFLSMCTNVMQSCIVLLSTDAPVGRRYAG